MLGDLRQDLAFAIRGLRRRPLFTIVAVAILAIGIGANTAVFSLVNAVLLKPLPYDHPERLVMLSGGDEKGTFSVSERERARYRAETGIFSGVGTWMFRTATVAGDGEPERLSAAYVDANVFPVAGIQPILGRAFASDEEAPGAEPVVMLTEGYWRRRFGGDRAALGRRLLIDGQSAVIVGVVSREVRLPGDFTGPPAELYVPLTVSPTPDPRNIHYLFTMARLRPDVSPATLRSRLNVVARDLVAEIPMLPRTFRIAAPTVKEDVLGSIQPGMVLLLAAVGLLLLLACANIAGLLLANAESRRHEFAVRTALGAGPRRLVGQVLTECLALGVAGGAAGLGAGALALNALLAASPPDLPRINQVGLDGTVLVFALGTILVTVLLFGLAPAMTLRRRNLTQAIGGESRGTTLGRERHLLRRGLVFGEIMLAVTIAASAGLVVRSWFNVLATNPGFNVQRTLTFQLSLPQNGYTTRESRWQIFSQVRDALTHLPGVQAAGGVTALPLAQFSGDWGFNIDGRPPVKPGERHPFADRVIVTPGYFEAMQIPLAAGRLLTPDDDANHQPVILINESVARRYWPNGDAVGARIMLTTNIDAEWRTVVGVVSDIRSRGLDQDPRPEFYFPHAQFPGTTQANAPATLSWVVRASGDPATLTGEVRAAVHALEPAMPVSSVQTMGTVLDRTLSLRRFQLMLLTFFAGAGLVLVAVGIYGVVAFLVGRRTREFGVRMALGASSAGILRMVLRESALLGAAGAAGGLIGAVAAGRLIRNLLFEVGPLDPVVLSLVPALVVVVVVAAALAPALRAARTDPAVTLRME